MANRLVELTATELFIDLTISSPNRLVVGFNQSGLSKGDSI